MIQLTLSGRFRKGCDLKISVDSLMRNVKSIGL